MQTQSQSAKCCWQVWDSLGRLLYQSAPLLSVVTAVAWSPASEVFAVGAYDTLLLCHASGWLCSKVIPCESTECHILQYSSSLIDPMQQVLL